MVVFVGFQLAGVVAVEVTGGPEILFHPGREVNLCIMILDVDLFFFDFVISSL